MEDQEQELERVSSELEDLQGNMGQVMEILQVIKAKLDTQTTVVSEITGPTIEPQLARTMPTTWPVFGLPSDFTPPVKGAPGMLQSTQQTVPLPTIDEAHPVVHTFAPPLVHAHVQPYFEDQQHAPYFSDEDDERNEDIRGMKENFQILEKRLRAMEGDQVFGDAAREMCLVFGLVIPAKFKTPDFDKYEGHPCPKSHLIMRQMLNMSQKDNESFKEYAQRWREMASQVKPPLVEKELAYWFMDIVKPMFYERMFSRGFQRKKEGETNAVSTSQRRSHSWKKQHQFAQQQPTYLVQYIQQPYVEAVTPTFNQSQAPVYQPVQQAPVYQQAPTTPIYQQPRAQAPHPKNLPNQNRVQRGRPHFASIPMTYTELYPSLLHKGLVTPRPLGPPQNPLLPWYNQDAHYPFHEGAPGHDLEGCYTLKHIVRELVEKKILSFRDVGPNIKNVKTSLLALHAKLVGASLIDAYHNNCEECALYPRGCKVVRTDIQNLMDQGVLQVCGPATNEEISVIEPFFNLQESVEITYQRKYVVHPSPMVVCMPTPFPFESTKVVPWKYDITVVDGVVDGDPKEVECEKSLENVDANITNIADTSRMTRSGRIYTPDFNIIPQEPIKEATTAEPTQESGGV
ncbi:uncharacterized protein LOC127131696 [Lathyrus oleraceus]|uniref:uncharacterized protein LOC127131696 n=1 Tax=Pisum sativum TaxID=3888 RepID=UPI0021D29920|nr:uncharacterized protein LOC127131696 [Pisum sativum]